MTGSGASSALCSPGVAAATSGLRPASFCADGLSLHLINPICRDGAGVAFSVLRPWNYGESKQFELANLVAVQCSQHAGARVRAE
jgi:hypothetical protein